MDSELQKAIKRAESRAAVYSSLEKAYGSEATVDKQTLSRSRNSQQSFSNTSDPKVFQSLQEFIADPREKTRKYLHDQLTGKSIVVNSLKLKTEANKAKLRIQNEIKREHKASNTQLKKRRLCDPMTPCVVEDLDTLHRLWKNYALHVMNSCNSAAQLQARFHSVELIGARVCVIESSRKGDEGVRGIVSAVSKNCFYVSYVKTVRKQEQQSTRKQQCTPSTTTTTTTTTSGSYAKSVSACVTGADADGSSRFDTGNKEEEGGNNNDDNNTGTKNKKRKAEGLVSVGTADVDRHPPSDKDKVVTSTAKTIVWGAESQWEDRVFVHRVIKSSSVLALTLPVKGSYTAVGVTGAGAEKRRQSLSVGGNVSGGDIDGGGSYDKVCILYGDKYMPHRSTSGDKIKS